MIALLKSRYVGPRVLERFDAASTEGEVQEHWRFAWRKGKAFFLTIRVRLVGTETPSILVGPALPWAARSCKSTEESPRMRMLAANKKSSK